MLVRLSDLRALIQHVSRRSAPRRDRDISGGVAATATRRGSVSAQMSRTRAADRGVVSRQPSVARGLDRRESGALTGHDASPRARHPRARHVTAQCQVSAQLEREHVILLGSCGVRGRPLIILCVSLFTRCVLDETG